MLKASVALTSRRSRRAVVTGLVGLVAIAAVVLLVAVYGQNGHLGGSPRGGHAPGKTSSPGTAGVVPMRPLSGFYGPHSEWTRDVSAAPLAADSASLVRTVASQVAERFGGNAAFNVYSYTRPFYEVGPETPLVRVRWDNCQHKSRTPPQLYDPSQGAAFVDVPLPDDALPAAGTDGALTIWDAAKDTLWEFWKAARVDGHWQACWGGRIDHWSQSKGYFANGMGVSASGLSTAAGSIGIREIAAGRIDHAMNLSLTSIRHWSEFSYPAQRSDGGAPLGTPGAVAEGQRFRLDPHLDVASLHLTPIATMIAKAAQQYGFIVVDKSGSVAVSAESGAGEQSVEGHNPWDSLLGGLAPYKVLQGFPWNRLQALPWNYGASS